VKVYLVTSGDHDYFKLRGIYSTPELAETARQVAGEYSAIHEFELDQMPEGYLPGLLRYEIWMRPSGEVCRADAVDCSRERMLPDEGYICGGFVRFDLFARDKDHAIELANEKRVKLILDGKL
jgi:hypothetical protein